MIGRQSLNTRALGTALLLIVAGGAQAHIPLTPEILDDALGEIERASSTAESECETAQKAAAIYDLATSATSLMTLLNQEIQLHGRGQQELIDAAVARAAELGVEITWSEDHQRYFYSGRAYRQYLELAPDGLDAANSRFQLLETSFYRGDAGDREELLARIGMATDYLERYPELGNAGRVVMFLAIDYRDLWRLCRATNDLECADRYATRNREHLQAAATRYANDRTGELARTLLERFEAELAASE